MEPKDSPFAYVTDQDALSPDEREAYFDFWASRTMSERLREVFRLNKLKWGEEVFKRGIDKTKLKVVNMVTGEETIILNGEENK
ncbi:MAG: hypothetical protein ACKVRN_05450 [Pyrinomonadaceae bacterium]